MTTIIKALLLSSVVLGTVIATVSSNWLMAWIGLEMNTLAIIPLMANNHPRTTEAMTKYFLVQATSTALLLLATCLNAYLEGMWFITYMKNDYATTIAMMALAMKLGLAPFHFWLPEVMQGLNLATGLILATWQKLAPLALLLQVSYTLHPTLLMLGAVLSVALGSWGGLNQSQLRKVLAYSSTAHLGWIVITLQTAHEVAMIVTVIYIISTLGIFLALSATSTTKIGTLTQMWPKNTILLTISLFLLMSLGGLPPLTGFLPKWCVVEELVMQEKPMTATMLVLGSLPGLFFYVRLGYFAILTIFPTTTKLKLHWRHKTNKTKIILATTSTMSVIFLPLLPLAKAISNMYSADTFA
uniref:NADH-ubiquinone oxidoreductase chain 2 n=1 Tax=Megalamphodus socolofi TaxID=2979627 RepID=A0A977PLL0_9TELE|nr:NADH dehydrogenase subunit 2 [Hyphessobrycon socolofi]UXD78954.1 NADH dehydrogenase subunit 2 [Hyphessobrycon socolofi]